MKSYKPAASFRVVPFTGGILAIYAFFWPEAYGHWLGMIVHAFRATSGI